MRDHEEFDEFLEQTLLPDLREKQARYAEAREAAKKTRLPFMAKIAIAVAGAAAGVFLDSGEIFFGALVAPFFIDLVRAQKVTKAVAFDVKQQLVRPVLEFWDPSISYTPGSCMPRGVFEGSGIWEESYDLYGGEDLVEGKLGATAFRFSEINLARKYKDRTQQTFFGLFFVADFNKEFRGRTLVLPDISEGTLGVFGRALQKAGSLGRGDLVELENPDFERHFKVYSTDPTEARYLLSTSLMQRVVSFRESQGSAVRMTFVGGRLHLLFPLQEDLFRIDDPEQIDRNAIGQWTNDLFFATGVIEDLDLNTRIWSKD